MTIRPIFAWYDLWVGVFVDLPKRRLYVFPLPMVGMVIEWKRARDTEACRSYARRLLQQERKDYFP